MTYPTITIPGRILILKTNPMLNCKTAKTKRPCGKIPALNPNGNITKAERDLIILTMRRQWGRSPITSPVNIAFSFYVPFFYPSQATDLSNSYQLYEDLMQEPVWRTTKEKGFYCSKEGAGIISNDKQIHGHSDSGFYFLCDDCPKTDPIKVKRLCPTPKKVLINKEFKRQNRSTVCPYQRIEIEISDIGRREISYKKQLEIFKEGRG